MGPRQRSRARPADPPLQWLSGPATMSMHHLKYFAAGVIGNLRRRLARCVLFLVRSSSAEIPPVTHLQLRGVLDH